MPYCPANGVQLYYELYGAGAPLVFVHGSGGNHASWFHQIQAFSSDYRVIVYDQRGFGNSQDPAELGRSAMVADLLALLDHLELERVVLVAQSLGGGTCSGATVTHPERVGGLVLCDTLAGLAIPEPFAGSLSRIGDETAGLTQAVRVLGHRTRERHPEMAVLYSELASFNRYRVGSMPGDFTPVEVASLGAMTVPILFVVGEDDILFPPDIVRGVSSLVPGARFAEIPEVGHSAYLEDHESFNAHLRGFLDELGIPAGGSLTASGP